MAQCMSGCPERSWADSILLLTSLPHSCKQGTNCKGRKLKTSVTYTVVSPFVDGQTSSLGIIDSAVTGPQVACRGPCTTSQLLCVWHSTAVCQPEALQRPSRPRQLCAASLQEASTHNVVGQGAGTPSVEVLLPGEHY